MLLLRLNKVDRTQLRSAPSGYIDRDDEGDQPAAQREDVTRPVFIAADKIRNFQPRRDNALGTRITFIDGGGYAVQETVDQIVEFLGAEVHGSTAEVVQISATTNNSQH